ncbi:hypothetical protein QUF80_16805 [Desulfococcaceae bacterium HSG8]|nr:hypothetical protein [Desulfococcaceae bacterium HSG8]
MDRNVLTDIDSEIYVSLVTYWEISLKYSLGKLDLTGIRPDELPQQAEEIGAFSLEISEEDMASNFDKIGTGKNGSRSSGDCGYRPKLISRTLSALK